MDPVEFAAEYSDRTEKPVLQFMAEELRFSSTYRARPTSLNAPSHRFSLRGVDRSGGRASFVLPWLIAMAYAAYALHSLNFSSPFFFNAMVTIATSKTFYPVKRIAKA